MKRSIGQILVELGYAKTEDIDRALDIQRREGFRRRVGEILRDFDLKESELLQALSVQFILPILDKGMIESAMPLEKVSFEFLRSNLILPVSLHDNTLIVAIADPTKSEPMETLRATFDYDIKIFLAEDAVILSELERLEASKDAVMQRLLDGVSEESRSLDVQGDISHLKDLAQEKGIIQLANLIIENAVKESSSDIHIEPEESSVRVRYRIDGILYERETLPLKTQAALASRVKLMSQMNIAERRLPQDGRITGRFGGKEIDIRVSTLPTVYGESIVMRLLDKEISFLSLEQLGFDQMLLNKYQSLITMPHGMILITGPTGSGKTTTLYASLDRINSPDKKIITVEEPVEYLMKGINQIQVKSKTGLTFASGLRHIVRQDPDIIMVGEIRDLETAGIAIHASLTGHLLFSTLHTNDSPSAVTRLIDMGVENYLVSSTLIGVAAQRLVRQICPACKEEYKTPDELKSEVGQKTMTLWRGRGCPNCMNTGYRGRIGIFELFVIDDDIRDLIMAKATARDIKNRAVAKGMRTLREDGLLKAARGITTIDEVFRVTHAELAI